MQLHQIVTIVVIVLSLAVQIINLAAKGMDYTNLHDMDRANGNTLLWDINRSYVVYGITAASLSIVLYSIILVCKFLDKSLGSIPDFIIFQSVIMLQFALGIVMAVQLSNNDSDINTTFADL